MNDLETNFAKKFSVLSLTLVWCPIFERVAKYNIGLAKKKKITYPGMLTSIYLSLSIYVRACIYVLVCSSSIYLCFLC